MISRWCASRVWRTDEIPWEDSNHRSFHSPLAPSSRTMTTLALRLVDLTTRSSRVSPCFRRDEDSDYRSEQLVRETLWLVGTVDSNLPDAPNPACHGETPELLVASSVVLITVL